MAPAENKAIPVKQKISEHLSISIKQKTGGHHT